MTFRKFIRDFAHTARPLTNLLKKDAKYVFGPEQHKAFTELKRALLTAPVLHLYNKTKETELHTDASKDGYGAMILQRCSHDKMMHPIYYMSRKTTPADRNYHSYELEALAVIRALEKFDVYLQGISFKIITDCAAFQQTMQNEHLRPRVARWAMMIEMYDYKIEHRPGNKMQHVDPLSRKYSVLAIHGPLIERMQRAQKQDGKLEAVRASLEKGQYQNFVLENDLIFEQTEDGKRLVIPKGLQIEIIGKVHD